MKQKHKVHKMHVWCVFRMGFHTMGRRRLLSRFMLGVLFLIWMASAALRRNVLQSVVDSLILLHHCSRSICLYRILSCVSVHSSSTCNIRYVYIHAHAF